MSKLLDRESDKLREMVRLLNDYELMRVHRLFDLERLKKSAMKTGGMTLWRRARKYHSLLRDRIADSRRLTRLISVYRYLRSLAIALVAFVLPLFFVCALKVAWVPPQLFFFISVPFLLFFIVLLWIVVFLRWYTKDLLMKQYGSKKFGSVEKHLKEIVQWYVDRIADRVKRFNLDPNNFRFRLFTNEYEHIKILKKPGLLNDFYLAVPDVGQKVEKKKVSMLKKILARIKKIKGGFVLRGGYCFPERLYVDASSLIVVIVYGE